jgi:hypothetical protein
VVTFGPLESLLVMARRQRIRAPGDIPSVVVRAQEGRTVLATEEDRTIHVRRMARGLAPGEGELLAWAVLVNRSHLLLRVTDAAPGTVLRRLNAAIAIRERRMRRRSTARRLAE